MLDAIVLKDYLENYGRSVKHNSKDLRTQDLGVHEGGLGLSFLSTERGKKPWTRVVHVWYDANGINRPLDPKQGRHKCRDVCLIHIPSEKVV